MKNSDGTRNPRSLIIICVALLAVGAVPLLSRARTPTTSVNPSTSVNIVNNSNKVIRNVYLSHVDVDDWGANQLSEGATIAPGQSYSLGNLACDRQQVKVIGEDQDGCFVSTVVNCGDNATWTITNDTARDCGGGGGN
jgi:hypothetical protein